MRKLIAIAFVGLALAPSQARAQTPPQDPLAPAENAFAVDLYGKLGRAPGNLFFSPYSAAASLDMVYVGARGSTAEEIARTLHLNALIGADLRAAVLAAAEKQRQTAGPSGFELQAANALWGDRGYAFHPDFIADIKTGFGADLEPVDFKRPEQASAQINDWAAQQTHNKIRNLVSPQMLSDDPPLVLTNAVYFKAAWRVRFDPAATKQARFHVSALHDVTADMMNMNGRFLLTEADGAKVLSIPYGDASMSMVIILPDAPQGLSAVEANLSAENLSAWLAKSEDAPVILSMPKFRVDCEFDLNNALESLGMNSAFSPGKGDFTGIADDPRRPIYIGSVVQKAYVDVDEEGTEAAAATAVVMTATAARFERPQPPVRFIADHPFIYLIRSSRSGEILFMGRVNDPTQHGD